MSWTTEKKIVSPRMLKCLTDHYPQLRAAFKRHYGALEIELQSPYERVCIVTPEQLDRTIGLDEEPLFNREWAL